MITPVTVNSDVEMLSRRIQRLEALVDSNNDEKNLAASIQEAREALRKLVPDEVVAAYRALSMPNNIVTLNGITSHYLIT